MNKSFLKLIEHGQSYWIDNLTRDMIQNGELKRRVTEEGLRGVTSNPSIFDKAISKSKKYNDQIEKAFAAGRSAGEIYEDLVTTDVRDACDVLRPVYDQTKGADGFVSLEVSPHLAHDTGGSIEEAKRLWKKVDRPNLFIKIPGTSAGTPAVEELLFEGININITLLFSIERYEAVAQAHLRALERRLQNGRSIGNIASVASFFLSRIDTLVDQLLSHRVRSETPSPDKPDPKKLMGKAATANAKLAYQSFKKIIQSDRWKRLEEKGARSQRMLWASTSTKNPDYPDTMYIEPLIGPHTVNTLPDETIAAFADHGIVKNSVEEGIDEAKRVMEGLNKLGIDFHLVTEQLLNEGIQKFIDAYDEIIKTISSMDHKTPSVAETKTRKNEPNQVDSKKLEEMANKLRQIVIRMTTNAGSGHPTSCMSCAEIISALFFNEMRWDPGDPKARNVDSFILSKGHAAPILWAVLSEAGAIDEDPMTLRKIDSTLEGHPTPNNPWVKVATGSLGQGICAANGIALANRMDKIDARVYCLLGDGECSEGSVWEAAQFASLNKLSNLVAIVDENGLGQSGPAPYDHNTSIFARRFQSFGWKTVEIDGHNMNAVLDAFGQAKKEGPTAIIAKTVKGKGVSFLEGKEGWHGKTLDAEQMKKALKELGDVKVNIRVEPRRIGEFKATRTKFPDKIPVDYKKEDLVATRTAFGNALKKLGELIPEIVVLDGDVKNSTYTEYFAKEFPDRFFESYIAEQNMVGTGLGLAASGKIPYAATFACFLSRAYDFIRMAGHSRPPHFIFCGSHCGISIGEDGPSQMGLEDLAMFRAVINSTIFYPSDAISAERLTELAAQIPGIVYIRTSRPKSPIIYSKSDDFTAGGSKTLRSSKHDRFTIIGAGVTLHEALAAYEDLKKEGTFVRVIDAYSVKPLDSHAMAKAAEETGQLIVVEDHWIDGGLGDAVAAAAGSIAPVHRLAVSKEPRSGKPEELMDRYGISRRAIVQKVSDLMAKKI